MNYLTLPRCCLYRNDSLLFNRDMCNQTVGILIVLHFVLDEEKIANENEERPYLQKSELEVVLQYVHSWTQRFVINL